METNSFTTEVGNPPVTESIQDALHSTKQALAAGQQAIEDITAMQQKVEHSLDWRAHVRENPWFVLGVAAIGGLLLSAVFSGSSRSRRYRDY